MKSEKVVVALIRLVLSVGLFFFSTFTIMQLWNWFLPDLLGLAAITFLGAFGLRLVFMAFLASITVALAARQGKHERNSYECISESIAGFLVYTILLFSGWIIV